MPILKPEGYRKDVPYFLKDRLFNNPSSPVVAYGIDKMSHIEYEHSVTAENFDEKLKSSKIEALKNLMHVQLNIQVQIVEGNKLAFVSGHEYASEKILDKDFMKKVANKIGASDLLVGIPFKGHLIAADSASTIRSKFPGVIIKYYENPQQDVISPHVFLLQDGEIVGIGGSQLKEEDGTTFSISEDSSTHNYMVNAKCSTIDELKDIVNTTYQQILLAAMKTKDFGGEINYHIDGDIQDTPELRSRCKSFKDQINSNEMAQTIVEAITKSGIKASFFLRGELLQNVDSDVIETMKENDSDLDQVEDKITTSPALTEPLSSSNNPSIPAIEELAMKEKSPPPPPPIAETPPSTPPPSSAVPPPSPSAAPPPPPPITNASPPKTDSEIAEEEDYSNLSIEELDAIFYRITSVPNARTHVPSLIRMTKLMDAYDNLGTDVPSQRKQQKKQQSNAQRKPAKRPENWGKSKSRSTSPPPSHRESSSTPQEKKWWKFW